MIIYIEKSQRVNQSVGTNLQFQLNCRIQKSTYIYKLPYFDETFEK